MCRFLLKIVRNCNKSRKCAESAARNAGFGLFSATDGALIASVASGVAIGLTVSHDPMTGKRNPKRVALEKGQTVAPRDCGSGYCIGRS